MNTLAAATTPWARQVLCLVLALFAACPVLLNLAGTYIADGQTFLITTGSSLAALLLTCVAALRIGLPVADVAGLSGALLGVTLAGGAFWFQWLAVSFISPSPLEQLRNLVYQSLVWIIAPLVLFTVWHRSIDTVLVMRWMVILCLTFVVGMLARWALGLGIYHSGRWHAGESLEAIRSGRYSALALWVFTIALLCPREMITDGIRRASLVGIPLAVFLLVVTNARGPWLALAVTLLITAGPLATRLAGLINRDARRLLWLLLGIACTGMFVLSQIGAVESDFDRLFTVTNDGGSAAGRIDLFEQHAQLIVNTPIMLLCGFGYSHGLFYPHNMLLEALVAGGIPCLLLLLTVIGLTVHCWLTRPDREDMPTLLFVGIFIFGLVGAQVSGSVGNEMMPWYGALLLALRVAETTRNET